MYYLVFDFKDGQITKFYGSSASDPHEDFDPQGTVVLVKEFRQFPDQFLNGRLLEVLSAYMKNNTSGDPFLVLVEGGKRGYDGRLLEEATA